MNIPNAELVAITDIKTDNCNPNRMTKEQHERLAASIKRWGFIVPIITNKDLLIADGEQRFEVAKSLDMLQVPVIRLNVEDVDRRLLRQVLNKLRGEHDFLLDSEEFMRIVEAGHEEDLKYLLALSDEKFQRYVEPESAHEIFKDQYEVVIECADEASQEAAYNKLIAEGYKCRVLTL